MSNLDFPQEERATEPGCGYLMQRSNSRSVPSAHQANELFRMSRKENVAEQFEEMASLHPFERDSPVPTGSLR